jgi:hypothetical protein
MALMAIGYIGTANAAEKIRWEEIPARIAPFGTTIQGLRIQVTTVSGERHTGWKLEIDRDGLVVDKGWFAGPGPLETISREQVARIEIRRGRDVFNFTKGVALFALGPPVFCAGADLLWCLGTPIITPAAVGIAAASAPVTLLVDGVEFLIPPKVWEIVR